MSTSLWKPRFRIESLSTTLGSLPRWSGRKNAAVWVSSWPGVLLCVGFSDYISHGLRWILFVHMYMYIFLILYIYIYIYNMCIILYIILYIICISPYHMIKVCDAWAFSNIPVYLVESKLSHVAQFVAGPCGSTTYWEIKNASFIWTFLELKKYRGF